MFGSKVYRYDDPGHVAERLVLSAFHKAVRTKTTLADPFTELRLKYVIEFKQGDVNFHWRSAKQVFKADDITSSVAFYRTTKLTKKNLLYAIRDLGIGRDGHAWLCLTSLRKKNTLYPYVLKFWANLTTPSMLKHECTLWNIVFPEFEVCLETWSKHDALRMPYFPPFLPSERAEALTAIEAVLRDRFVAKAIMHDDVAWRNIGKTADKSPVIFDFASATPEHKDDKWVNEAIEGLKTTLTI